MKSSPGGIPSFPYESNQLMSNQIKVGVFVHLHHQEFVGQLFNLIDRLNSIQLSAQYFVTTTQPGIAEEIRSLGVERNEKPAVSVSNVENRGRNFGPLFTEFSDEFAKYDYCIHLHSKKSEQLPRLQGAAWAQVNWDFLGLQPDRLASTLSLLETHRDAHLAFVWNPEVTQIGAFSWGLNRRQGGKLALRLGTRIVNDVVVYPPGGMFIARGDFLSLVAKKLSLRHGDFPKETGQIDGTLQHAVERCIGFACQALGGESLIFDANSREYVYESDLLDFVVRR
jgi:lipopolysaccharide biosynthesis protein